MHFFPTPLPDELLFSILARYHAYSGNESHKNSVRDLFDSKTTCAVVDLPCNLFKLGSVIPGRAITANELLLQHTLFPYFSFFLPQERFQIMKNEMLNCEGSSIHMKMGLTANGVKNNNKLKYCPTCVKQDREAHGVAYWHRAHQLPGVMQCHNHATVLIDSVVSFASRRNKHEFFTLEKVVTTDCEEVGNGCNYHFCSTSNQLLQARYNPIDLEHIRKLYILRLQCMGLVHWTGRVKFQQIISQFTYYYGESFLKKRQSFITKDQQDSWLHKVLRKDSYVIHPLRHLLLLSFLELPLESIVAKEITSIPRPFGCGPWPCLNKAAVHYNQECIEECKITRCSDTGGPVGTFSCECGFVYSRRGPDVNEESRFKIGRIKEFGEVWQKRLHDLNEEGGNSQREMARLLGVDPVTVKNQLSKSSTDNVGFNVDRKQEKIIQKRKEWLDLLAQPRAAQLSKTTLYSWLYRNDKEWLLMNPPESRRRERKNRIDWAKRDMILAEKVKRTVEDMLLIENLKVSKSEIGRKINALSLIQKKSEKIPLTSALIDEVSENTERFRMRRIGLLKAMSPKKRDWEVAKKVGVNVNFIKEKYQKNDMV